MLGNRIMWLSHTIQARIQVQIPLIYRLISPHKTLYYTLINKYEWELAPDTTTTWRIGDGTAAFYNYIYYKVAGFTEHDTFRSNQIREGDISREEALELIKEENKPRYPNIKWYLDTLDLNFEDVIKVVNEIKPLY